MIDLNDYQIENNCQTLWSYGSLNIKADNQNKTLIGFSNWNFIKKIIFWIRDKWSGGQETEKVNRIVLATLQSINKQLQEKSESSTFFFRPAGKNCFQSGYTYKELAHRIIQIVRFKNCPAIKKQAQAIIDVFDNSSLGSHFPGLTSKSHVSPGNLEQYFFSCNPNEDPLLSLARALGIDQEGREDEEIADALLKIARPSIVSRIFSLNVETNQYAFKGELKPKITRKITIFPIKSMFCSNSGFTADEYLFAAYAFLGSDKDQHCAILEQRMSRALSKVEIYISQDLKKNHMVWS